MLRITLCCKYPSALELFSWDQVTEEASIHAPLTFSLLINAIAEQPRKLHIVGFIITLFCHLRWNNMN